MFFLLGRLVRAIVDTIFPSTCVACGAYGPWFCTNCQRSIRVDLTLRCAVCFKPSPHPQPCASTLNGIVVTGSYSHSGLAAAVQGLKYRYIAALAEPLGNRVAQAIEPLTAKNPAVLIPVPLHKRRERERGYNQSALVAMTVAKRLEVSAAPNLVRRKRYTGTQTKLDKDERQRNLANAFVVNGAVDTETTYIIIDDVCTTGATLSAIAGILRNAGAAKIIACVVASDALLYRERRIG